MKSEGFKEGIQSFIERREFNRGILLQGV